MASSKRVNNARPLNRQIVSQASHVMRKDVAAGDWIASSRFLLVGTDHTERPLVVRIGRPYAISDSEWACPVDTDGLHGRHPDIHGTDSLQSLCLASSLVRRLLQEFVAKGGKVLHPEDRTEVTLAAVFGTTNEAAG
jgi:hypothetical protein